MNICKTNTRPTNLLYRESGIAHNYDVTKPRQSPVAMNFSRQYIYDFAADDKITTYLVAQADSDAAARNPMNNEMCTNTFTKNGFFHDMVFKRKHFKDSDRDSATNSGDSSFSQLVAGEFSHPCGDDLYVGCYDLLTANKFNISWSVTGPNKAFSIVTEYSRI